MHCKAKDDGQNNRSFFMFRPESICKDKYTECGENSNPQIGPASGVGHFARVIKLVLKQGFPVDQSDQYKYI